MKQMLRIIGGILCLALLFGCAGTAKTTDTNRWTVELQGVRRDSITASGLAEAKGHPSHYREIEVSSQEESCIYRGIPLKLVIAMIDGSDSKHPWLFDSEAWDEGYEITFTARDGYAVSFISNEVDIDSIYLADEKDGKPIAPRIVGEIPSNLQIKDLKTIEIYLSSAQKITPIELELQIGESIFSFNREELEALPIYIEEAGGYTTSAGTRHSHIYGGVGFADFIQQFSEIDEETTVSTVASDGYTMSYSGKDLLNTEDGTWILAFKQDGEYLPLDPGYFRSVKVGPDNPDIDGHSSARMIERIVLSEASYRDYELKITGAMDSVLDRQTIQSGVSCHETQVAFWDKKSETSEEYTGIPLWMLLAYGDDPEHAPHHQTDKSILSYKQEKAAAGYIVRLIAADGYSIDLDSRQLDKNNDVIIATHKDGAELPEREWPMILVWDKDAKQLPDGIKAIRNLVEIQLIF